MIPVGEIISNAIRAVANPLSTEGFGVLGALVSVSGLVLGRGDCVLRFALSLRGGTSDSNRSPFGLMENAPQLQQRLQADVRSFCGFHASAMRSIEHPCGNLDARKSEPVRQGPFCTSLAKL